MPNPLDIDIHKMLTEIASMGGDMRYEGGEPFPRTLIDKAQALGLLIEIPSGGLGSAAEILELTALGRARAGMRAKPNWRDALNWLQDKMFSPAN
ncbi:hypothetical protein [Rhizobium sp. BK376]|uniref:hypothetical protein n=1 Tax=Rhizobium sp. BK376 TaxID=2512149 RepID=UPI00104DD612|nr:hypothetical protein [Rhizobium sp. BK376]TCR72634.1 hypothetical protein EV561_1283 [Rhizobium sp. BK376]